MVKSFNNKKMGYLDTPPEPYKFPTYNAKKFRKTEEGENLEALNNDGREEVKEDFSDSPFLQ